MERGCQYDLHVSSAVWVMRREEGRVNRRGPKGERLIKGDLKGSEGWEGYRHEWRGEQEWEGRVQEKGVGS